MCVSFRYRCKSNAIEPASWSTLYPRNLKVFGDCELNALTRILIVLILMAILH